MFKKILENFKKPTPKKGKGLAGIGLSIAGIGGLNIAFSENQLIQFVPEEYRAWVAISIIAAGVITSIWGKSQVDPEAN